MSNARDRIRFEQVERFLASGMGVSEWCALNNVANSTLYDWMSRYRNSEPSADLSNHQKRKETTEWIKFSREELANSVALALKQPPDSTLVAQVPHQKDTESPWVSRRLDSLSPMLPA